MKSVHNKVERSGLSLKSWLSPAAELENENPQAAIKEFKKIALVFPNSKKAYERLMVLFRKLQEPKNEIYWIDKAIDNFQNKFNITTVRSDSKVAKLSKSIATALELIDKKGVYYYQPDPVGKWLKRRSLLLKKIVR